MQSPNPGLSFRIFLLFFDFDFVFLRWCFRLQVSGYFSYAKITRNQHEKRETLKITKTSEIREKLFAFKGLACIYSKCFQGFEREQFFANFASFRVLFSFRVFSVIFAKISRRKNVHPRIEKKRILKSAAFSKRRRFWFLPGSLQGASCRPDPGHQCRLLCRQS